MRSEMDASAIATIIRPAKTASATGHACGVTAIAMPNGITTTATQARSRVRGTIISSTRNGHLFENVLHHFADAEAFNLKFRPENETMLEDRGGHALDIVRRDEIPSCQRGLGATGEKERLGSARSCPDQHTLMSSRGAHHVHRISDQFFLERDVKQLISQPLQCLGRNDRLHGATRKGHLG